jgi:hypothetical protein
MDTLSSIAVVPTSQPTTTALSLPSPAQPTLQSHATTAATHLSRIATASTVISALALAGKIAAGWIPYVSDAIGLVQGMWEEVEKVAGWEVAAWRMVRLLGRVLFPFFFFFFFSRRTSGWRDAWVDDRVLSTLCAGGEMYDRRRGRAGINHLDSRTRSSRTNGDQPREIDKVTLAFLFSLRCFSNLSALSLRSSSSPFSVLPFRASR